MSIENDILLTVDTFYLEDEADKVLCDITIMYKDACYTNSYFCNSYPQAKDIIRSLVQEAKTTHFNKTFIKYYNNVCSDLDIDLCKHLYQMSLHYAKQLQSLFGDELYYNFINCIDAA